MSAIDLKFIPTNLIEPNAWNPQGMNVAQFDRLKKEMSENGFIAPIQVVPLPNGRYRILGGEHRWSAAVELGLAEIPCAILKDKKWEDEDIQKFVTVRLNALHGELDAEKFVVLYTEMSEKYGAEAMSDLMAFTDKKAFAKVLGGVKKNLKKILPKEMHGAIDKATKEAKSVEDLGAIVNMLFAQYGDTVDKSFMIFTYGKADHLYIQMSKETKRAVDRIVNYCRATGSDINSILEEPLRNLGEALDKTVESIKVSKPAPDEDAY